MTGRPKEFARRQLILPKRSSIADSSPACIDAHREVYGVEPNCKVLPITPSTYREHDARRDAIRRRRLLARARYAVLHGQTQPVERPFRNRVHMTSAAAV